MAVNGLSISSGNPTSSLPSATSVVNMADSHDRAAFAMVSKLKEEPMDVEALDSQKEEDEIDIELSGVSSEESSSKEAVPKKEPHDSKQNLQLTIQRHAKFLDMCREIKVGNIERGIFSIFLFTCLL